MCVGGCMCGWCVGVCVCMGGVSGCVVCGCMCLCVGVYVFVGGGVCVWVYVMCGKDSCRQLALFCVFLFSGWDWVAWAFALLVTTEFVDLLSLFEKKVHCVQVAWNNGTVRGGHCQGPAWLTGCHGAGFWHSDGGGAGRSFMLSACSVACCTHRCGKQVPDWQAVPLVAPWTQTHKLYFTRIVI